ncbi:MAG TPA: hypothetical protein VGL29_06900 [Blastocatellia bacterium]|jgi:hypothetical protein
MRKYWIFDVTGTLEITHPSRSQSVVVITETALPPGTVGGAV